MTAHLGDVNIKTSISRETAGYQLSTSLGKVVVDGAKYEEAVRDENQSATDVYKRQVKECVMIGGESGAAKAGVVYEKWIEGMIS